MPSIGFRAHRLDEFQPERCIDITIMVHSHRRFPMRTVKFLPSQRPASGQQKVNSMVLPSRSSDTGKSAK
jgi:hypothetical protein